jgi:glycerol-3-phosphate dehydrogenase
MYDILVIGGGINGCGIARTRRGADIRCSWPRWTISRAGTSSWSTKLIHGGLRYLEHYEFRLVREALMEREVLWSNAPRTSSGRCGFRAAASRRGCGRPGCCGSGCSSTTTSAGAGAAEATRTVDLRNAIPPGKPVLKPEFGRRSSFPTAGSTMRGWSF